MSFKHPINTASKLETWTRYLLESLPIKPAMLSPTIIQLLLKEPFWGHFLALIQKEVTTQVDTLATGWTADWRPRLVVNPDYWTGELAVENLQIGELKHQLLHLICRHTSRAADFQNDALFGIAADLAVNQFIDNQQLTPDAIRLEDFWGIELERHQTAEFYYARLLEVMLDDAYEGSPARWQLNQFLTADNRRLRQHHFWASTRTMSKSEQKIADNQLRQVVREVWQKHPNGNLPAELVGFITQILENPLVTLNWKHFLRLFVASSNRTFLKNTMQRPSKRYGTTPGLKVKKRQKILVVVDTSASMDMASIALIFQEIRRLWKQGAVLFVAECDAAVQAFYAYRGDTPNFVKGRGGTSYDPAISLANTKVQPDLLVFCTDGKGNPPTLQSRCPFLWLVTPNGIEENSPSWLALKGKKIKIKVK